MNEEAYKAVIKTIDDLTGDDPEAAHWQADQAIIDYLRYEGCTELANAYENAIDRCSFWYA